MEEVEFLNPSIEKDLIKDEWFCKNYDNKNVVTVRFDGIKYGKKTLEFINKNDVSPESKFYAMNKVFLDELQSYLEIDKDVIGKVLITAIRLNDDKEEYYTRYLEFIIDFNYCTYDVNEGFNEVDIRRIVENCWVNMDEDIYNKNHYLSTLKTLKYFGSTLPKGKLYYIINLGSEEVCVSRENLLLSKEEMSEINDYSSSGDLISVLRVNRDKYRVYTLFDKDVILFINKNKRHSTFLLNCIICDIFEEFKCEFEERMFGIRKIKMFYEPMFINLKSSNFNCIIGYVFLLDLGIPKDIKLMTEDHENIMKIIDDVIKDKINKKLIISR